MKKNHIHFMGIGGSGMSASALIAKHQGYTVSGCDLLDSTPYLGKVKAENIKVFTGHNKSHVEDVDILCVTPAVLYQNKSHPEVLAGRKKNLMSWQEFVGKYLQKGKKVISITGTHGKSTTTTIVGLIFEEAGLDPTVEVGATVLNWKSNCRVGKGDIFVNEADEFFGNFLHYNPDAIILNNIEFDHPDYFKSEEHVVETFEKFVHNLNGSKTLIFNQDSNGIEKLFKLLGKEKLSKLNLVGYTLGNPVIDTSNSFIGMINSKSPEGTAFTVTNSSINFKDSFKTNLPGDFNVSNSLGTIALASLNNIQMKVVKKVLSNFTGSGRRLEFLGEKSGVKIYDDYAHHPTAIRVTLSGLRQLYPSNRIICIVEPHMFSRTKKLLRDYKGIFSEVDKVLIAPIYQSRDKERYGVSGESISEISDHKDIHAFDSLKEIMSEVTNLIKKGDVVVVMGAGKSYQLARDIYEEL